MSAVQYNQACVYSGAAVYCCLTAVMLCTVFIVSSHRRRLLPFVFVCIFVIVWVGTFARMWVVGHGVCVCVFPSQSKVHAHTAAAAALLVYVYVLL